MQYLRSFCDLLQGLYRYYNARSKVNLELLFMYVLSMFKVLKNLNMYLV